MNLYIGVLTYCVCWDKSACAFYFDFDRPSAAANRCQMTKMKYNNNKSSILIWLNQIRCTIYVYFRILRRASNEVNQSISLYRKRLNECNEFRVNEYMFFFSLKKLKRNEIIVIEQHTHKQTHICYAELRTVHSFMQKADDVIRESQRETYCTTKSFYSSIVGFAR